MWLALALQLSAAAAPARQVLSLDGAWQIVFDRTNEGRAKDWGQPPRFESQPQREMAVPSCWEETEQDYEGVAWYMRRINIPAEWKGRCIRLQFDAVNYFTEVWLNGMVVGDHEGGYTPFEFEVSDLVNYGAENKLVVRVVGPAVRSERVDFLARDEAPHWRGGYMGGRW